MSIPGALWCDRRCHAVGHGAVTRQRGRTRAWRDPQQQPHQRHHPAGRNRAGKPVAGGWWCTGHPQRGQLLMGNGSSNRNAMINLTDIAPSFSLVTAKGLVPAATSDYRPRQFGNADFVLEGHPFSLRFERDRGQVFVNVGGAEHGWEKLEHVLEFVDEAISQRQLGEPPDPEALSALLELNWDRVTALFSDREKLVQLQSFSREKSATLLERLFRKS
jgi:hypothetical protein